MDTTGTLQDFTTPLTEFEHYAQAAKTTKDFAPVWRAFLDAAFFVVIPSPGGGEETTATGLSIFTNPQNTEEKLVIIAAQAERLKVKSLSSKVIRLSAPSLLDMLDGELGLIAVLSNQTLRIPASAVKLLKKSALKLESNKAFPAINMMDMPEPGAPKNTPIGTPINAPTSATASAASSLSAPSAASAPPQPAAQRQAAGQTLQQSTLQHSTLQHSTLRLSTLQYSTLQQTTQTRQPDPQADAMQTVGAQRHLSNAADLQPRRVFNEHLGLEMFVPTAWKEKRNGRTLTFVDPETEIKIEATGFEREMMNIEQWTNMRLPMVETEMPHLSPICTRYPITGDAWRGRIQAMIVEYQGTAPGDDEESRFLLCCLRTDQMLVSITISAKTSVYLQHRAIFKWLLQHVDIVARASATPVQGSTDAAAIYGNAPTIMMMAERTATPDVLGFSVEGRLGRLRYLAYTWPVMIVFAAVVAFATLLSRGSGMVTMIVAIPFGIAALWMSVRVAILRLHDLNFSGKWLLAPSAIFVISLITQAPALLIVCVSLYVVGTLAMLFWPGNDGANSYGSPCDPNPTWVVVCASISILFMVLGGVGNVQQARTGKQLFGMQKHEQPSENTNGPDDAVRGSANTQ